VRRVEAHHEAGVEAGLGLDRVPDAVWPAPPFGLRGDRFARRDRQGQVDVMDHQVQYGRDVPAPFGRRTMPQGLQQQRLFRNVQEAHRLEHHPLLVAAGDDDAGLRGRGAHLLTVGDGDGDRLLHIDMPARGDGGQRLFGMEARWRGDGDHVHLGQELVQAGESPAAQGHGDLRRAFWVGVEHADEVDAGDSGVLAGMVAPEDTGADDAAAQGLAHGRGPNTRRGLDATRPASYNCLKVSWRKP